MPAKNRHHDVVIAGLRAEGWRITHEPFVVALGSYRYDAALGAERDGRRIAIEIPKVVPETDLPDFQRAIGAYALFRLVLKDQDPTRELFHAAPEGVYRGIYTEPLGDMMVSSLSMRLIVFREEDGRISRWIEADGTSPSHVLASRR
jgi:hypothetical protein